MFMSQTRIFYALSFLLVGFLALSRFSRSFLFLQVVSGSMSPVIPVGSIVLVDTRSTEFLVGNIYTYKSAQGNLITHRLKSIDSFGYHFKGDAVPLDDPLVVSSSFILGKVILVIPYFGYVFNLVRSPLFLLAFFYLPLGFQLGRSLLNLVSLF